MQVVTQINERREQEWKRTVLLEQGKLRHLIYAQTGDESAYDLELVHWDDEDGPTNDSEALEALGALAAKGKP